MATKKHLNDDGHAVSPKPAAPTGTRETANAAPAPSWRERVSGKLEKSRERVASIIGNGGASVRTQERSVISTPWGAFYDSEALQASLSRAKERTALLALLADVEGMRIAGGIAADRMDELLAVHRHTPAASRAMTELAEALRADDGAPLADQVPRLLRAFAIHVRDIADGPDPVRCERAPDAHTVKPKATQIAGTGHADREERSWQTYDSVGIRT